MLPAPKRPPALPEFIALMAMMSAFVAFSIDAMLPALPAIAADLSPDAINKAQLVLSAFIIGMGAGTLVAGPMSDRFGRRPVVMGGVGLYLAGAVMAWLAHSLEILLAARLLQGLGASGPRIVTMAITRDLYAGARMARIMSFIMIVFSLVPAVAPLIGAQVTDAFGWRSIFLVFMAFVAVISIWFLVRQPETLAPPDRRPLSFASLGSATAEVFLHRTTRLSIMVQALSFAMLFATISSVQQVFDTTYDQGAAFPYWFGAIAVLASSSGFLNARLVERLGMRAMVRSMLAAQIGLSAIMILTSLALPVGTVSFAIYLAWTFSLFFQAGMTIGNLNALALEPMGHIAGLASSVVAAVATVGAMIIAVPIGLAFDGTARPLAFGVLICAIVGFWLVGKIRRPGEY